MTKPWIGVIIFTLLAVVACINSPGYAQLFGRTSQNYGHGNANQSNAENILFILDASDSMNDKVGGQTKLQAAKDVILKTIRTMPPNINVGLRVYGHSLGSGNTMYANGFGFIRNPAAMCRQSQLLVPLGTNNRAQIASQLLDVQAVGKTPITYSLQEAVRYDFAGVPGKKTIILVSDGQETCSYNPCDYALDMVRNNIQIKVNTIGFVTRDRIADAQLKCIALSTKGKFYSADTAADLARSIQDSMQVQTTVNAKISPNP